MRVKVTPAVKAELIQGYTGLQDSGRYAFDDDIGFDRMEAVLAKLEATKDGFVELDGAEAKDMIEEVESRIEIVAENALFYAGWREKRNVSERATTAECRSLLRWLYKLRDDLRANS